MPPERALAESIRAWMRVSGAFGRVVEPRSGVLPSRVVEATVTKLYGDFRQASRPLGTLEIHFICYEVHDSSPGRIVLDTVCSHQTPLERRTADALMAARNADLREIMKRISTQFAGDVSRNGGA